MTGRASFRPTVPGDAAYLAPRLREADKQEIKANSGHEPGACLFRCWFASDVCNTIVDADGTPIGMFGYSVGGDHVSAAIWMLASDDLTKIRKQFVRESRVWLDDLNDQYPILHNIVDARNELHIRWLRAMGCQFIREFIHGPEQRPFYEFVRTKRHV